MTAERQLSELLRGIEHSAEHSVAGVTILSMTADSRKVGPGSLFVCLRGQVADGHGFVAAAVACGAAAVVANRGQRPTLPPDLGLPLVLVDDTRKCIGDLAAAFYDHPAAGITLIGLTGTNGKTTTSFILEAMIRAAGGNPGVIGTINYRYNGHEVPATFTTPEPIALQRLLREMADCGVTHVIMEVSSHALALYRIQGLRFAAALFTNLTRDHLDFHQEMEAYYQAKKRLFTEYLDEQGTAVIVLADEHGGADTGWGRRLHQEIRERGQADSGQLIACSLLKQGAPPPSPLLSAESSGEHQVSASNPVFGLGQTSATIEAGGKRFAMATNLVGAFNLKNILGAVGVAVGLGLTCDAITQGLAAPIRVPGRLEAVTVATGQGLPALFVDYAHTPDALENVLTTLRQLGPERLLLVFGCGGDRDPGKRRLMGEIAGRLADVAILPADNSRSESTTTIMAEIEHGVVAAGMTQLSTTSPVAKGYAAIPSRGEAIALAVGLAGERDILLISGKGHETYQLTADGTIFFDDRLEAARCLREKAGIAAEAGEGHETA
jgi:UDP-N-acetylmuramyl-tripeptide synthetase